MVSSVPKRALWFSSVLVIVLIYREINTRFVMDSRRDSMEPIAESLQRLHPIIKEICQVSGNVGMSVGVFYSGQVIHRADFGYRDLENKIRPDSDTIYPVASLTKAMTAAAFGILAEDQKLVLDSLVMDVYPGFRQADETVRSQATIIDLLAHRTGLAGKNCYWHQSRQKLLLPKNETASTMSLLEQVGSLHNSFIYNNWVYCFAGTVLENLVGDSLGSYLQMKVFGPLGLKRTTLGSPPSDNLAKSYQSLDNGTPWEVPNPEIQDSTIMGSAGGVKSCVNDLLHYYSSFVRAATHQIAHNCTATPGLPFRQAQEMVQDHVIAASSSPNSQFYGLGLVLTELPSTLGLVGLNPRELGKDMPVVGRNTKGRNRVWYHNGSLPGAFSSVYMLPDSDAVVVVLSNTLGTTDTPDWVGQLFVESLVGESQPHNFVEVAKRTRDIHLAQYPRLRKKMADEQPSGTPMKPLESYAGRYRNSIGTFLIEVAVEGKGLRMWCQGHQDVDYQLYHYDRDIFAWEAVRDDDIKKSIFPKWYEGFHIVKFLTNEQGIVDSLSWGHDGMVPQGEVFQKDEGNSWRPGNLGREVPQHI